MYTLIAVQALQILFYIIQAFAISFVVWMAVDASTKDKYLWVVLMVGFPIIGAIIYMFVEKRHVYHKAVCKTCRVGVDCEKHSKK